jgi:hypothetical protein
MEQKEGPMKKIILLFVFMVGAAIAGGTNDSPILAADGVSPDAQAAVAVMVLAGVI